MDGCIVEVEGIAETAGADGTGSTAGSDILGAGTIGADASGTNALGSTGIVRTGVSIDNGWTAGVVMDTDGTAGGVAVFIVTKSDAAAGVQSKVWSADGG